MPRHPDADRPDSPNPVLLLAPLAREAKVLEGRLDPARRQPASGLERLLFGRLHGQPVALAVTGDGAARARAGAIAALEAVRPRHLLVFGVAGALSPGLGVGDLVWARRVVSPDGRVLDPAPGPSPGATDDLHAGVHSGVHAGVTSGTVLTHDRLVATPAARQDLLERATAAGRPDDEPAVVEAVVDLESWCYAAAAEAAGVPWNVLRAVSDTVDDTLPAYLEHCRDVGGSVRNGRVVLHALARPWTLPVLLRLGRRVAVCSERLADAVAAWLENRPSEIP